MKNIFILSNSFSARTISYQIDYLFNFEIGKVYILKENHEYSEICSINNKIELVSSEDFDKYIYMSDIVLILQDKYIPQKIIEHIKLLVSENTKVVIIDNPWSEDHCVINKPSAEVKYDTVPVVLQVVFGEYTQHYCTEILLNKILSNNNVPFVQLFSSETLSLIEQLLKYDLINKGMIKSMQRETEDYSVVIKSLYVNEYIELSKDEKFFEIMRKISPNYIMINLSSNCVNDENLKNIFVYKHNKPIDVIVKSPYIEIDLTKSKCSTYCGTLDVDSDKRYTPTSSALEKELQIDLFAKISLPNDIVVI